jgi:hypothetical protein
MRLLSTTGPALATVLLASPGSQAGQCTRIDTTVATTFFVAGCTSPVGICTTGTVPSGLLKGTTRFTALTITPGPSPDLLLYTGELVITTRSGTVTIRNSGMLDGATGSYFEFEQVVGGMRLFRHARGALTSQGIATGTGFFGTLAGVLCSGKHDDRHDSRGHQASREEQGADD